MQVFFARTFFEAPGREPVSGTAEVALAPSVFAAAMRVMMIPRTFFPLQPGG